MANLTDSLASVDSVARTFATDYVRASPLEAIARVATAGIQGVGAAMDDANQADTRARAKKVFDDNRADRDVTNAFNTALINNTGQDAPNVSAVPVPDSPSIDIDEAIINDPGPLTMGGPFGTGKGVGDGLDVPKSVNVELRNLQRYQAAEDQGRASPGSTRVFIEATMQKLLRDYPNSATAIVKAAKDAGIQHVLVDKYDNERKIEQNDLDIALEQKKTIFKAATDAGFSGDDAYMWQKGSEILAREYEFKVEKQRYEAVKANLEISDTQQRANEVQYGKALINNSVETSGQWQTQAWQSVTGLIQAAGNDPAKQAKILKDVYPQLASASAAAINHEITRLRSLNAPESVIETRTKELQAQRTQMLDLFTGDASVYKNAEKTMKFFQDTVGLSTAQSTQLTSKLKSILGSDVMALIATPEILTPDMLTRARQEIQDALDPDKEKAGRGLSNFIALMKGNKTFKDMTPAQAVDTMPSVVNAVNAFGNSITAESSPQVLGSFVNSFAVVGNAALGLQDVGASASHFEAAQKASSVLGSQRNLDALVLATTRSETAESAKGTLTLVRTAQTRNLKIAQGEMKTQLGMSQNDIIPSISAISWGPSSRGKPFAVGFNEKTGLYEVAKNPNVTTISATSIPGLPGFNLVEKLNQVNRAVALANNNLKALSYTNNVAGELPPGLTPLQIRAFYATGSTATWPKQAADKLRDPDGDFNRAVESARKTFQSEAWNKLNPIGDPIQETVNKIAKPSGPEGRGDNPYSTAAGLGQFTDSTWLSSYKETFPEAELSDAEILKLKTTAPENISMQVLYNFTKKNATQISRLGFEPTPDNLYIMHFAGEDRGPKVLVASNNTPVTDIFPASVIKINPANFKGVETIGDFKELMKRKMA